MNDTITNNINYGIGAGVAYINQLRSDQLLSNLSKQDINLENAIAELNQLRNIVAGKLQGSDISVHGIIAEHTQVHFSNARDYIAGKEAMYFKESDLSSPIDYWIGDTPVQSKFIGGINNDGLQTIKQTFTNKQIGIAGHLRKYPDFLKGGGVYQVPKDQYEHAIALLSKPVSKLNKADYNTIQSIREFEKVNNVKFEEVVKPSVVKYGEVFKNVIENTIDNEEENIVKTDETRRVELHNQAKATYKQGIQVAAVSAAIEGATNLGITVVEKFKKGKKIGDFTEDDWKEIFSSTAGSALKGGLRGNLVYALTNLTEANAIVATSLVVITFAAISLTFNFAKGELTSREYADNLQQLGTETGVIAAAAAIGQSLIPVPVIGVLIGSLVGNSILGEIKQTTMKYLQGSQFLVEIERAYAGTVEDIYESTQTFVDSLEILAVQHKDFCTKKSRDNQLTNDLNSLYNLI